ncbi:MAG: hypothetical protein AVDCRST_MAG54-1530, partial [uncultured Actinomycetospora sp.]
GFRWRQRAGLRRPRRARGARRGRDGPALGVLAAAPPRRRVGGGGRGRSPAAARRAAARTHDRRLPRPGPGSRDTVRRLPGAPVG